MSENVTQATETNEVAEKKKVTLTKKDMTISYLKWYFTTEASNSYERLQALTFGASISNCLKKLYTKKEDLSAALKRHLQFFNTEGTFGVLIHGVVCSMEEEKANGGDVPEEAITGLKTGLMGPLAGIGDTLIWGTAKPIIYGLGVSFAMQGSPLGAFIPFLFPLIGFIIGYNMWMLGYRVGRTAIQNMLQSGLINELITGASILGLFMMGALGSSYVKLTIPIEIVMQNANPIIIQDILNNIAPGLLPLGCILGIYYYFKKKGQNYNVVLLSILVISILGSLIGLF